MTDEAEGREEGGFFRHEREREKNNFPLFPLFSLAPQPPHVSSTPLSLSTFRSPQYTADPVFESMASTPHLSAQVAAASESPLFGKLSPSFDKFNIEWSTQSIATSVLAVVVALLVAEQTLWRYRKSTLPGHSWQIVSCSVSLLSLSLPSGPFLPSDSRFASHDASNNESRAHTVSPAFSVARDRSIRRVAQPDNGSLQTM